MAVETRTKTDRSRRLSRRNAKKCAAACKRPRRKGIKKLDNNKIHRKRASDKQKNSRLTKVTNHRDISLNNQSGGGILSWFLGRTSTSPAPAPAAAAAPPSPSVPSPFFGTFPFGSPGMKFSIGTS